MSNWSTYHKLHTYRKPKEHTAKAVSFCTNFNNALDLGAGTFVESSFLIDAGFEKVIAVDNSKKGEYLTKKFNPKHFEFINSSFQDFTFPKDHFDFINSQFALPFYGKENFASFIKNSLTVGGIFAGQFFGIHDSWNVERERERESKLIFQTKEEALRLLSDLEILEFIEEEKEGNTAKGDMKHWHIFHFIAKKSC